MKKSLLILSILLILSFSKYSFAGKNLADFAYNVIFASSNGIFDGSIWTFGHEFGNWSVGDHVFYLQRFDYEDLAFESASSNHDPMDIEFYNRMTTNDDYHFILRYINGTDNSLGYELRKVKYYSYRTKKAGEFALSELAAHNITGIASNDLSEVFLTSQKGGYFYISKVYIGKRKNFLVGPFMILEDTISQLVNGFNLTPAVSFMNNDYNVNVFARINNGEQGGDVIALSYDHFDLQENDRYMISTDLDNLIAKPVTDKKGYTYILGTKGDLTDDDPFCKSGEVFLNVHSPLTGALYRQTQIKSDDFKCVSGLYVEAGGKIYISGRTQDNVLFRIYNRLGSGKFAEEILSRTIY